MDNGEKYNRWIITSLKTKSKTVKPLKLKPTKLTPNCTFNFSFLKAKEQEVDAMPSI